MIIIMSGSNRSTLNSFTNLKNELGEAWTAEIIWGFLLGFCLVDVVSFY